MSATASEDASHFDSCEDTACQRCTDRFLKLYNEQHHQLRMGAKICTQLDGDFGNLDDHIKVCPYHYEEITRKSFFPQPSLISPQPQPQPQPPADVKRGARHYFANHPCRGQGCEICILRDMTKVYDTTTLEERKSMICTEPDADKLDHAVHFKKCQHHYNYFMDKGLIDFLDKDE